MRIGIIGPGNQGRAWAKNLQDSGVDVVISLRPESTKKDWAIENKVKLVAWDELEVGQMCGNVLLYEHRCSLLKIGNLLA